VTEGSSKDTIVVPWNDRDAVAAACAEHEFAAIIAEPLPANMGLVKPAKGFLTYLRTQADSNGALLILDEVISGFRVSSGGYQELTGITPDLTMLGKIVGGGLPAAAYAGRRDLMEMISPSGDVYQAGTLSGNPLAMSAGLATLAKLDDQAYSVLALRTNDLVKGLESAAEEAGVEVSVSAECGLLTVFFATEPPNNYEEAKAADLEKHAAWCRALLDRGIYAPPSQFEAWFPSLVHDDAIIERTIDAARGAFAEVAA
jgi:glutamate-1-semialdehyde 2,1-aminomutase